MFSTPDTLAWSALLGKTPFDYPMVLVKLGTVVFCGVGKLDNHHLETIHPILQASQYKQ